MEVLDDISSTCENDHKLKFANFDGNNSVQCSDLRYDCESDAEYDSENETIDVIYENSEINDKNQRVNQCVENRLYFFDQKKIVIPSKALVSTRNVCNNVDYSQKSKETISNVNSNKSKTFLIDSILGNNKKNTDFTSQGESDNVDEATDEHNGEFLDKIKK